ncbi:hypothetical protein SCHPADRAFT_976772 [Schizopora paradoxa]|uniref:ATP-dependent RNA helicase n=1 Tax=Schizopora paradoxa TaxID=27342 RepID=A0A0H2RG93_9AGAM|nr:hypothetical protein SCHPADRAFT_976772 [Schizopora paradoxa]
MGLKTMTPVQAKFDVLGAARTGSGKAVRVSPTREWALQIFGVEKELMAHHSQTFGIVSLDNAALTFPSRTPKDSGQNILEMGFEEEMKKIITILPNEGRQSMLFSATQTTKVRDLALRPGSLLIDVDKEEERSYVVCSSDCWSLLLFAFLKKNLKKIIVFFSSCNSVKYHGEHLNYIDVPLLDLHGKRTITFFEFCNVQSGVLLCTYVAARGLDIPKLDWIKVGKSRLFLLESELGYLQYLKEAKGPLNEFTFPANKMANVQSQVRASIKLLRSYFRRTTFSTSPQAYLQSYASYSLKKIFDINALDLAKVGKAFGFSSGVKRRRDNDDDDENGWTDGDESDREQGGGRNSASRRQGNKQRRIETLGKNAWATYRHLKRR